MLRFFSNYVFLKSILIALIIQATVYGQGENMLKLFPSENVTLLNSRFKNAQQLDLEYILALEPDRLLSPFLREAGLSPKAESYPNWENSGLDGHIGGHYVSALSLMYASTGNKEIKERLDYMLAELHKVQEANGNGYIGGVPGSKELWKEIKNGKLNPGSFSLNNRWVPLYNIHKTYAGLRDAYLLTDSELAKTMLIKFTDWMLDITVNLSEEQLQDILRSEHGGLNETFADVYAITKDPKYLKLAYDFSHQKVLKPLEKHNDSLTGMHANTQIPKIIGFETIAQLDQNQNYHEASKFFWETVVENRTSVIGGNSVREHFHPINDFSSMVESVQGPETCNTYNMLRLTQKLFMTEKDEKYIDFYERALYNHILSTQHPEKKGFVYFTPLRLGHYRVFSQPDTSFWCCVGSGLENHAKYNEMIYSHSNDELYINLFIPSTLNWEEMGMNLTQNTNFPNSENIQFKLSLKSKKRFIIKIRYPQWVKKNELEISINGKSEKISTEPGSYITLQRTWGNGNQIELKLPMHHSKECLPDGSDYTALKYGPIVLAAPFGKENLTGLFADASRGGHIPQGPEIPLDEVPMFVVDKEKNILNHIKKTSNKSLAFEVMDVVSSPNETPLKLKPFYDIGESRYAIYLRTVTPEKYDSIQKEIKRHETLSQELTRITIDYVATGEQQPESDHYIKYEKSENGVYKNRYWRDATGWFSYKMKDAKKEAQKLRVTYFNKAVNCKFQILFNGNILAWEEHPREKSEDFYEIDYSIPSEWIKNNDGNYTIKFQAENKSKTPWVFDIRLLKQ